MPLFLTWEARSSLANVNPKVSNVDESGNYIYIWDKVAEDLQFAYDNLPDIWASDKGVSITGRRRFLGQN